MADQLIRIGLDWAMTSFMLYLCMKDIHAKRFGWAAFAGSLFIINAASLVKHFI